MVWLSSVLLLVLQIGVRGDEPTEAKAEAAPAWQAEGTRLYKDLSQVKLELGEVEKVIVCLANLHTAY
jgi:hypothetical protein